MTPRPSDPEIKSRPIYDPKPGSVHIKALVRMKARKQNRISDYVMGMLWFGNMARYFTKKKGEIWETAYTRGMNPRKAHGQHGRPFLGPDGMVLELKGRLLHGDQDAKSVQRSPLRTFHDIVTHPNYQRWATEVLFKGGTADSYPRKRKYRKRKSRKATSDQSNSSSPTSPPTNNIIASSGVGSTSLAGSASSTFSSVASVTPASLANAHGAAAINIGSDGPYNGFNDGTISVTDASTSAAPTMDASSSAIVSQNSGDEIPNTRKGANERLRPSDERDDSNSDEDIERYLAPSEARKVRAYLKRHGSSHRAGGREVKISANFSHYFPSELAEEPGSAVGNGSLAVKKGASLLRKKSKTVKKEEDE